MHKRFLVAAVVGAATLALFAGACSDGEPPPIEGSSWVLTSFGPEGATEPVVEGTTITAEFNADEMNVTGSAGCNTYFGVYEVDGNDLSIGPVASTERACLGPDPTKPEVGQQIMGQEQSFLAALGAAQRHEVEGGVLTIFTTDDQVLVFSSQ